jgi:hypothetical protein
LELRFKIADTAEMVLEQAVRLAFEQRTSAIPLYAKGIAHRHAAGRDNGRAVRRGRDAGALAAQGGRPAELSPETIARLDRVLPPTWSRGNPVDIIGDALVRVRKKLV